MSVSVQSINYYGVYFLTDVTFVQLFTKCGTLSVSNFHLDHPMKILLNNFQRQVNYLWLSYTKYILGNRSIA